jgi:hypothetical protein
MEEKRKEKKEMDIDIFFTYGEDRRRRTKEPCLL